MTREEILAMEPGRELDALVAEKVMGWHIRTGEYSGKEQWYDENGAYVYGKGVFTPSSLISHAWEVVEKLRPDLHWFGVDLHGNRYRAIFRTKENRSNEDWYEAFALTVPEAICKAALLAVVNT